MDAQVVRGALTPQTLPHDPRQWRSVLDPPNGCGERQEQIRTIDPRPLVQNPAVGTTFQPNARVVLTNGLDFHVEERSNEAGFLDRPLPPLAKSPGVCRIAFIGDSMVEAAQVPIGQKVQVVIQKRLEAARPGKPVETMAFGFSGTGQVNQLGYLETFVRPRKPDVIVLVFVSNDFANNSPLLEAIRVGWHPAHAPRMRITTKPDTEYERSRTAVRRSRTAPPIDGFTDS